MSLANTEDILEKAQAVYIVSTAAWNYDDVEQCLKACSRSALELLQVSCGTSLDLIDPKLEVDSFNAVEAVSAELIRALNETSSALGGTGVLDMVKGEDWQVIENERITFLNEMLAADSQFFWETIIQDIKIIENLAKQTLVQITIKSQLDQPLAGAESDA